MDVCHNLLGRPWQFDNDVTCQGYDNVMMFSWGTHKIAMAPVLHLDKSLTKKKTSYLVMTQNENELDEANKENECFCLVVRKGLMSDVNEEVSISEEVLEILGDFKELIAWEQPNHLSPMRDK
jgi:hypothetical protein